MDVNEKPSEEQSEPAQRRLTIAELEKLLNSDEDTAIEILPNGEVRAVSRTEPDRHKPLTMRENLGGEYVTLCQPPKS